MTAEAWWRDFTFERGAVRVRKTGALVPVSAGVAGEVLAWLRFYLAVEAAGASRRADGPKIWFAPDRPRPWYLVWAAGKLAGLRTVADPAEANLGFYFDDATSGAAPEHIGARMINAGCTDVSKSRVAAVFEAVTGRTLAVDPASFDGPMAVKSETNGVHDGRVVAGPAAAEPGLVYQRLIDNLAGDGLVEDLRCPTVAGDVPVVFLKRRPLAERFANHNSQVRMLDPGAVFSAEERGLIADFCAAMGLEWGGLDVLRDRSDGALWIVDVNKTDMGPPTALPLADKMAATRRIAASLRAYAEKIASGDRS
ncbi:MAG: hypothetical protein ABL308_08475 [Oceanicaulis sp.]